MNAASTTVRVAIGPFTGSPPTLEWIGVDRLLVDTEYQRRADGSASRRIIGGMLKEWKWPLCQPLAVSRRVDGSMYVLDGQHRLEGARQRGDIPHLPCVVVSGIERAAEASTYIDLNTARQKLSENDKFLGMLAAGDPDAITISRLLEVTSWTITRKNNTSHWNPGELQCAPMLARLLGQRGEHALRFALGTLRAAYPDTGVRNSATMLKALVDVFTESVNRGITANTICERLGKTPPSGWISRAHHYREKNSNLCLTQIGALAAVILNACDVGQAIAVAQPAPNPAPSPPPRASKPAAPAMGASPFNPEGKAWCDQCDKRVSRGAAAACGDRHCKLRQFT